MTRVTRVLSVLVLCAVAALASAATAAARGSDPGPPAQSGSPHDTTVYSVRTLSDGSTVQAIYDPAPGVSPVELAATLKTRGIKNVTVDHSGSAIAKAACSYGTARTFNNRCPMPRYTYRGHNHPQVYFIDHSSAGWPLTEAVPYWNRTQGLDSWYRWHTQGCPGSTYHCVNVWSDNYGKTGSTGTTYLRFSASGRYITWAKITLNDYYGGTGAQHRNTACHETGHALGLGHNTSTGSCLYYARTSRKYPNGDDFSLLQTYY